MIASARSRDVESVDGEELRTRKQFLQTLEQLGGKFDFSYYHSAGNTRGIDEVHSGFLSCSLDTWVCHFGEPEEITEHCEFAVHLPLQCWEYRCTDGPVKCVGRLFERWPNGSWVIVTRVSIPLSTSEVFSAYPNNKS